MQPQQGMLPDVLAPDLVAVFVGTSVSTTSAEEKHYYAHPQQTASGSSWMRPGFRIVPGCAVAVTTTSPTAA